MNDPESFFAVVTIDGGAASGKSSTARGLSERLNLLHVDTGSHYRSLTHAFLEMDASCCREVELLLKDLRVETRIEGRTARMAVNGEVPPPSALRRPAVNERVSHYAAIPVVRLFLLDFQRQHVPLARERNFNGVVMEGRDIGSIVLPDADFRFFLCADPETRAQRRKLEGQSDSITERDRADSSRLTAPLICPKGATRLDTGNLTLKQVIDRLCKTITGTAFTELPGA